MNLNEEGPRTGIRRDKKLGEQKWMLSKCMANVYIKEITFYKH